MAIPSPIKKKRAKAKNTLAALQKNNTNSAANPAQTGTDNNANSQGESSAAQTAAEVADAALADAALLPPAQAHKITRLATPLKQAAGSTAEAEKNAQNDNGSSAASARESPHGDLRVTQALDRSAQELSQALVETAPARAAAQIGGAATAKSVKSATALASKKPEDMNAQELRNALDDADAAIAKGKILAPADAGLLVRALAILKQALLDLGGVSADGKLNNREELDALLKDKLANENTSDANATEVAQAQAQVNKAVNGVKEAQAQIADNRSRRGDPVVMPENPTLDKIKSLDLDNMSAEDIAAGIEAVEMAITENRSLIPADASLLQRIFLRLKQALLQLGGVDPQRDLSNKEELLARLKAAEEAKSASTGTQEDAAQANAQAKVEAQRAIDDLKQAEVIVARRQALRDSGTAPPVRVNA